MVCKEDLCASKATETMKLLSPLAKDSANSGDEKRFYREVEAFVEVVAQTGKYRICRIQQKGVVVAPEPLY